MSERCKKGQRIRNHYYNFILEFDSITPQNKINIDMLLHLARCNWKEHLAGCNQCRVAEMRIK